MPLLLLGFFAFVGFGVLGSLVGDAELGKGVGLRVGIGEGTLILSDGFVVGPADEMAGLEDGDRDGAVEGALLGAFVGDELGLFDGDCEGSFVGETVGDVDGDFVFVVGLADAEGELVMVGVELGIPEGVAVGV